MVLHRGLVLCLLALGLASVQVYAQARASIPIAVRVISESGEPVEGAAVQLARESGDTVAVQITDAAGLARFNVPQPGSYVFIVERLGLAAWRSGPKSLTAARMEPIELRVPLSPVRLDSLAAEGEPRCSRTRPLLVRVFGRLIGRSPPSDNPAMLPRVHALTMSLLLHVVQQRPGGAGYVYEATRRGPSPEGDVVTQVTVDTVAAAQVPVSDQPHPDLLAAVGYIWPGSSPDTAATYHLPTPEVITAESFTATHCFRVVEQPDSGLVGLAFEPIPGRENHDVRGVVWLDTIARRVHRIDFNYTRLAEHLVDSGEWSRAMQEASRESGQGMRARVRRNERSAVRPTVVSRNHQQRPAPDEKEFGGEIVFGEVAGGRWDILRWRITWPGVRASVSLTHDLQRTPNSPFPAFVAIRTYSSTILSHSQSVELLEILPLARSP